VTERFTFVDVAPTEGAPTRGHSKRLGALKSVFPAAPKRRYYNFNASRALRLRKVFYFSLFFFFSFGFLFFGFVETGLDRVSSGKGSDLFVGQFACDRNYAGRGNRSIYLSEHIAGPTSFFIAANEQLFFTAASEFPHARGCMGREVSRIWLCA